MPDFDSVLFDFDGVLLDTEPMHCACWAEVLAPLGVTLEWDFYSARCIGIDDRDMLRMMADAEPPAAGLAGVMGSDIRPRKSCSAHACRALRRSNRHCAEVLPALQSTHKLAVVSSSSCSEIEPLLVNGGIRAHFGTVIGGDTVQRLKPASRPLPAGGRASGREIAAGAGGFRSRPRQRARRGIPGEGHQTSARSSGAAARTAAPLVKKQNWPRINADERRWMDFYRR